MIVCDPRNPKAQAFHDALREHLETPPDDLIVVIGGDGFLLRTIREHGFSGTFLGLNAGHLGFLLNDVEDWETVAGQLANGAYTAHGFPLLHAKMTTADDQEVITEQAINDVYLERSTGQTAHLALSIDGHRVVDPIVADGIIFATALGSTAYTFSAGGVACHPTLRTLSVTPICPHHPRLSPFALPSGSVAKVDVHAAERRPVRGVVDGHAVEDVISVEVAINSSEVQIAYLDGHDFTAQMITKILHP